MPGLLETPNMLIRLHHNILTSVNAVQGDTGRIWNFVIDDYEIPLNSEVRMYVRKPSGKEVYHPAIVKNQVITFQPTEQTLAETGQSIGSIQIVANGQSVTTFPFFVNVERNYRLTSGLTSKDEFLILDELIVDARKTLAEMKALIQTATTQENARVAAEKVRATNENQRIANENARKQAETGRVNAENTRVSNENARKQAESSRVTAESGRVSAEASRVSVEKTRVTAESQRNTNENARKQAETARASAETTRNNNENTRKSAETGRVNAEKVRVTQENARVEAEKLRQQNTTTAINNANSATSKANEATTRATNAAVRAENAVKGLEGALNGIINDTVASQTTTYSSTKINALISAQNVKAITNTQIDSLAQL